MNPQQSLRLAVLFEYLYEMLTDHLGISAFDVMALYEVDQFPILE